MTAQKESPGVAGRGFRGYRGVIQNPQDDLEADCQNCQDIPEPLDMLMELYFVHLQRWADAEREVRQLAAEIVRLQSMLTKAVVKSDAEMAEATRLQRLAHERGVI